MKPFSYYKKNIDSILEHSYNNKKLFKENFHVIMGALKISKPFREFFTLYNEVEQKQFKNKTELGEYINESVNYLQPKIKSIKTVCNILENVFNKRSNLVKKSNNKIYENLDYLIYKKGVRNISKRIEVKNNLIESVLNLKPTSGLSNTLNPKTLAYTHQKITIKSFLNYQTKIKDYCPKYYL